MKIIWSKKAEYNFDNIENYLREFWSSATADNFIKEVLHTITLLESNPLLGKHNSKLKCRSVIISRNVTLYYEVREGYIELLSFFNNKQKPLNILI